MKEGDTFNLTGHDGRTCYVATILRVVTLRGIPGFAIHEYESEFRISHIETGAYLPKARGDTDGEAFVLARKYDKEDLEEMIAATVRELERLRRHQSITEET